MGSTIPPRLGSRGTERQTSMDNIKSIATVNTTAGWAVRVRMQDGSELFAAMTAENGHRFTMAEAGLYAANARRDIARHGWNCREDEFKPLPKGVRVVKS